MTQAEMLIYFTFLWEKQMRKKKWQAADWWNSALTFTLIMVLIYFRVGWVEFWTNQSLEYD